MELPIKGLFLTLCLLPSLTLLGKLKPPHSPQTFEKIYEEFHSDASLAAQSLKKVALHRLVLEASTFNLTHSQEKNYLLTASCMLSGSSDFIPFFQRVLDPESFQAPQTRLLALNALASLSDERAYISLLRSMRSPELWIALEASYRLFQTPAGQTYPGAYDHLESLTLALGKELIPFVIPLYTFSPDLRNIKALKQFLHSPIEAIQNAATRTVAEAGIEALSEDFLTLSFHISPIIQEAFCLFCFNMKSLNQKNYERLTELIQSPRKVIRTCARLCLFKHTKEEIYLQPLIDEAKTDLTLFLSSLNRLIEVSNPHEFPPSLVQALLSLELEDKDAKLNQQILLLKLGRLNAEAIRELIHLDLNPIPIRGISHSGFYPYWSYKIIEDKQHLLSISKLQRTQFEAHCLQALFLYRESEALAWCRASIEELSEELYPMICARLIHQKSEAANQLLEEWSNISGRPLLRHYARLNLWRGNQDLQSKKKLLEWLSQAEEPETITFFKPLIDLENLDRHFTLEADEKFNLILEIATQICHEKESEGLQRLTQYLTKVKEKSNLLPLYATIIRELN